MYFYSFKNNKSLIITRFLLFLFTFILCSCIGDGNSSASATAFSTSRVCSRTTQVLEAILKESNKQNCTQITIQDLHNIKKLYLYNDNINSVKISDFVSLINLTKLQMHYNDKLSTLPTKIFAPLRSLKTLNLSSKALITKPSNNKFSIPVSVAFDKQLKRLFAYNLPDKYGYNYEGDQSKLLDSFKAVVIFKRSTATEFNNQKSTIKTELILWKAYNNLSTSYKMEFNNAPLSEQKAFYDFVLQRQKYCTKLDKKIAQQYPLITITQDFSGTDKDKKTNALYKKANASYRELDKEIVIKNQRDQNQNCQ